RHPPNIACLDLPHPTVSHTADLWPELKGSPHHGANGRIESGRVATTGENPDPHQLNRLRPSLSARPCGDMPVSDGSTRSAWLKSSPDVIGLGTATQRMPAAFAALTPLDEPSRALPRRSSRWPRGSKAALEEPTVWIQRSNGSSSPCAW